MSTIDLITEKTGVTFRPASSPAMEALHALGVPEEIVAFRRQPEPSKCIEIGKVRIWPVASMLQENRDYVPAYYAWPCGYVVFSTTICGDAYCFDLRAVSKTGTPIVLIAHDLEPKDDEMKREDLAKPAQPIAHSFEVFLEAFLSASLDSKPLYPPFESGSQPEAKR
jgi:hypothetical protein